MNTTCAQPSPRRFRSPAAVLVALTLMFLGTDVRSAHGFVAPSAPLAPTAVAFDRAVRVAWMPPAEDGGIALDLYRVTWVQGPRSIFVPADTLSVRFGSLPNGTAASFTVAAHSAAGWSPVSPVSPSVFPTRPNVIVVITDDQRWDSLDQMPLTMTHGWRQYTQAFVPEPQCCPARASLLSGRLPHHTGVDTLLRGHRFDASKTFATMLRSVGYRTILLGKYLNGYPFGRPFFTPPGWEYFRAYTGSHGYFNYTLRGSSGLLAFGDDAEDYSTDRLGQLANAAILATPRRRPVLLYLAPTSPHWPLIPAPRHIGSCDGKSFPLPPSFNAVDPGGEPAWMGVEWPVSSSVRVDERRLTCAMLQSVDEMVDGVIDTLAASKRLQNSLVIFTSDNGFLFGEHRLVQKGVLYEEAIRVPLLIRGPGVRTGTSSRLTSSIDLAPSIVEWARATPPVNFFDGRSLRAEAAGASVAGPTAVLLRGCRTTADIRQCGGYSSTVMNWGVRTARWKYIEYSDGYVQLFDLSTDPFEMTNLGQDPAFAAQRAALRARLRKLGGGGPPTIP